MTASLLQQHFSIPQKSKPMSRLIFRIKNSTHPFSISQEWLIQSVIQRMHFCTTTITRVSTKKKKLVENDQEKGKKEKHQRYWSRQWACSWLKEMKKKKKMQDVRRRLYWWGKDFMNHLWPIPLLLGPVYASAVNDELIDVVRGWYIKGLKPSTSVEHKRRMRKIIVIMMIMELRAKKPMQRKCFIVVLFVPKFSCRCRCLWCSLKDAVRVFIGERGNRPGTINTWLLIL